MATKNNPGQYDCYANAEPDEPMFVLLGRDKHAPALVWLWCVLRELDGEDLAKVDEAQRCVLAMVEWLHGKGKKSVGIGQAAVAAVLELVRSANANFPDNVNNKPSDVDMVRRFFTTTPMESK